jgi:hypothetical protein
MSHQVFGGISKSYDQWALPVSGAGAAGTNVETESRRDPTPPSEHAFADFRIWDYLGTGGVDLPSSMLGIAPASKCMRCCVSDRRNDLSRSNARRATTAWRITWTLKVRCLPFRTILC